MSIVEVAKQAGVSIATVSRVINKRRGVARLTAQRVQEAIDLLGYVPPPPEHRRGPSLKPEETPADAVAQHRVAFLWTSEASSAADKVGGALLRGATQGASELNARLFVDSLTNASDAAKRLLDQHELHGLLLHGPMPPEPLLKPLRKLPAVWLLTAGGSDWGDRVQPDNFRIGELAATYLVESGHEHLCAFTTRPSSLTTPAYWIRANEFRSSTALLGREATMLETPGRDVKARVAREQLDHVLERFFSLKPMPTGIFIANDLVFPIVNALERRGLRTPDDIEIVCCNRHYMEEALDTMPLTVIDIRADEIGRYAIQQLLWRCQNPSYPILTVHVAPRLMPPQA